MSAAEYLSWEKAQPVRHEFIDGKIYAMTGGSKAHNLLTGRLYAALLAHPGGGSCQVFVSDVKVQLAEAGPFFYPDIVVTCDARDAVPGYTVQYPCLVVEVLSPSTEAWDRGGKFQRLRRLPSLLEYLLVDSRQVNVELYRHPPASETWTLDTFGAGSNILLRSVNLSVSVNALYAGVQLGD
jgi:Uma2 family endonuclease